MVSWRRYGLDVACCISLPAKALIVMSHVAMVLAGVVLAADYAPA